MRPVRLVFVLFGALLCAGCERSHPGNSTDRDARTEAIRQIEEQLRQGMLAGDTILLGSLWAPEYLSTSAVGHTSTRTESLMAYGSGLVRIDSAVVRDLDVRIYGETAVSLGLLDWAGAAAAQPFAGTVRFQHVWVRQEGTWRLVASQLTNQPGIR